MMAQRAAVRLFVLLELALHARATFVVLAKSAAPQCFLFEFPPDTQLTLSYTMPAFAGVRKPESSVTVSLLDRKSKKQVFSRAVANERGSLSFSTVSEEPHDMCLTGTNLADPLRFDFLFEIGQGDGYYEAMATEEHMDKRRTTIRESTKAAPLQGAALPSENQQVAFPSRVNWDRSASGWAQAKGEHP